MEKQTLKQAIELKAANLNNKAFWSVWHTAEFYKACRFANS